MRINFYDLRLTDSGGVTLVKERGINYGMDRADSPAGAAQLAEQAFGLGSMAEEHACMVSLDSGCRVTGVFLVSKGTADRSLITPRELYIRALLVGAVQIILIHNHPSGRAVPSELDIKMTERIKKAGEMLGIPLADHIIIAGGGSSGHFSFKQEGML